MWKVVKIIGDVSKSEGEGRRKWVQKCSQHEFHALGDPSETAPDRIAWVVGNVAKDDGPQQSADWSGVWL